MRESLRTLTSQRRELRRLRRQLEARQLKLLHELLPIYPIAVASHGAGVKPRMAKGGGGGTPEHGKTNDGDFEVRGLRLPLNELEECEDEQLSTALGYVSHLVFMISKYLRVPLRYAIFHNASRSCLHDCSASSGAASTTVEYPLYKKGVEREKFQNALYLLKKDIEQLMYARGTSPAKGSHLLANLKALLTHETSSAED